MVDRAVSLVVALRHKRITQLRAAAPRSGGLTAQPCRCGSTSASELARTSGLDWHSAAATVGPFPPRANHPSTTSLAVPFFVQLLHCLLKGVHLQQLFFKVRAIIPSPPPSASLAAQVHRTQRLGVVLRTGGGGLSCWQRGGAGRPGPAWHACKTKRGGGTCRPAGACSLTSAHVIAIFRLPFRQGSERPGVSH